MLLLYLYIFILGLCLGSFFNVAGLRIPKRESIIHPPSHCPACNRKLSPLELIPVFSYLFLRGKCKACGAGISPVYPVMELLTAMLFSFAFWKWGWSQEVIISWVLISLLMIISVSDLRYMIIPDRVLAFFAILFVLLRLVFPMNPWWDSYLGALLGFSLLFLIAVVSRGGMGGGDIKLFAVLGLVLGWKGVLVCFLLAVFSGALIGGIGLLLGIFKRKQPISFGPFIAVGALIAYFYQDELLTWYIHSFMA